MGEGLVDQLAESRVDLGFVARTPQPSPLAFVTRGTAATGARYAFYLGSTAYDGPSTLPTTWSENVAHLHVGSFSAIEGVHTEGGGFIAVGALHLVGPHSVLDLLGQKGYRVTRLAP